MDEAYDNINAIYNTAEEMAKECIQVMAVCRKWNDLLNEESEPTKPVQEQKKVIAPGWDAKEFAEKAKEFAVKAGCAGVVILEEQDADEK